jgi:uncharacterized protein (TIGR02145 family)
MKKVAAIITMSALIMCTYSCRKDKSEVPSVSTSEVTGISYTTAVSGGIVTGDGGDKVVARGVCWSTSSGPTLADSKTTEAGTVGAFSSTLATLVPDTKYYVKAYATNANGTGFGREIIFTTNKTAVPLVTTAQVTAVVQKSVIAGGTIVSDNGSTVVAKGVCWSKNHSPVITDSKSSSSDASGTFNILVTSLDVNTTYYVRAWATNRAGTSYGDEVSFTTADYGTVSDVDGNSYRTITIGNQVWMADNLRTTKYSNGDPIPNVISDSEWGELSGGAYCWYNNSEADYKNMYGALYNWFTVTDSRGICPAGWRIPDDSDWTVLIDYLTANGYGYEGSGDDIAKSLASATGWTINDYLGTIGNNQSSNNTSGFEAKPAGVRIKNGTFDVEGFICSLWSSKERIGSYANAISLSGEFKSVSRGYTYKLDGASVRCLMNN